MEKDVQDFLLKKIKSEYSENTNTEYETLVKLDRKVKLPPTILAYSCGIVGSLLLGFGMSLIMTDIGTTLGISAPFVAGIVLGVLGLIVCGGNYPTYQHFLNSRKKEFSKEILRLADKLSAK